MKILVCSFTPSRVGIITSLTSNRSAGLGWGDWTLTATDVAASKTPAAPLAMARRFIAPRLTTDSTELRRRSPVASPSAQVLANHESVSVSDNGMLTYAAAAAGAGREGDILETADR